MTTITVTTQAELDAALGRTDLTSWDEILIDSPRHVWLDVMVSGPATVRATGSATVTAYESVTVRAYDSVTVTAYDRSRVVAYDSATVRAAESATVRAYESATVTATGSATVTAYDSATVRAYDSATVAAYESVTVTAGSHVAVHLHSALVRVTGGVVIDVTALDLTDPEDWTDYTGAEVVGGEVILHKAVDGSLTAGHNYRPTAYPVGEVVTATDWRDDNDCGGGLHASPHPEQAIAYAPDATRMLRVAVPLADLRPIAGALAKAKAQTVRVLEEVKLDGSPLAEAP